RQIALRLHAFAGLSRRACHGVGNADVVCHLRRVRGRRLSRLAVFDLDGTLIDSRRDLADSANEMLAGYGAAALPEEQIGHMIGSGAETLVARALKAANVDASIDNALARFLTSYDRRLTNHTRPYPGVPDLLE